MPGVREALASLGGGWLMVRGRRFSREPVDYFWCGSTVIRDPRSGLLKVSLPENLLEKMGIKEGDSLWWKDYYRSPSGETVIRIVLRRNT